ncbi:MAG TPA: SOS response-associated peptidase, partial [Bacteroidales bacterium]|nr:SOS response-associated peptidase [Bacteroidales bacterium]
MCGRFSLTVNEAELNEFFETSGGDAPYVARYNCAPTQMLAVITNEKPRQLSYFKWGLIPGWAKDPSTGHKMINARAETLSEKPSYKTALRTRRCLVPADAFYEWRQNGDKIPYRIFLKNSRLFAFAGLWDRWRAPDGSEISSFTIITTGANEFMQAIHNRMPVILNREDEKLWLGSNNAGELLELLKPYPGEMDAFPVSKLVNSPANDFPEVMVP